MSAQQSSSILDNAAWSALGGAHAHVADVYAGARRYDPDVSVFHAAPDDSPASWEALAALATKGVVVLFRAGEQTPPAGWTTLFAGPGTQMVLTQPLAPTPVLPEIDAATGRTVLQRALTLDDVPAMTELVAMTEPGPFRPRTIELGGYVGIFHGEALVAMAGQRIRPAGHCEVSAVCTHPEARRRGYASIVTAAVAAGILARGETPFLHTAADNVSAQAVYRRLGFEIRTEVTFAAHRIPT